MLGPYRRQPVPKRSEGELSKPMSPHDHSRKGTKVTVTIIHQTIVQLQTKEVRNVSDGLERE